MKKIFAVIIAIALCASFCIFVSADSDPDTYLFTVSDSGVYTTGYWMGPNAGFPNGSDVMITFETPNAFDGFAMAAYASASPDPAVLDVTLLDENDNKLETVQTTVDFDHPALGDLEVVFSKAYAKGLYTIQMDFISGGHFVLAAGDVNPDIEVAVSGNNNNQHPDMAPVIVLIGAEAPTDVDPGTEPPAAGPVDTWLCKRAQSFGTGWWMTPDGDSEVGYTDAERDILVTFETPNAFDGFEMACFAPGGEGAHITVSLYDEDDELIKSVDINVTDDHNSSSLGFIQVDFGEVYAEGIYTIQLAMTARGEGAGIAEYFVLGSGKLTDMDVSVSGLNNAGSDAEAPAIKLLGAELPETGEPDNYAPGDVNKDGSRDNKDVVALFRYVSGTDKVEDESAYDYNGDKTVDNKDVVALFRFVSSR